MTDNNCCKCTTPQYTLTLNGQGPQGIAGKNGQDGISPTIDVVTNTASQYILSITDVNGTKRTPNLKGGLPSGGITGQVLIKYGSGDGQVAWQNLPIGTTDTAGVFFANQLTDFSEPTVDEEGVATYTNDTAVTPAGLVELLNNIPESLDDCFNGASKIVKLDANSDLSEMENIRPQGNIYMQSDKGIYSQSWYPALPPSGHSTLVPFLMIDNTRLNIGAEFDDGGLGTYSIKPYFITDVFRAKKVGGVDGDVVDYKLIDTSDIATTASAGIVKPDGTTITVDADGTIHGASTYNLPIASSDTLGGVKIGNGLSITDDGTLSATGGGSSDLNNITDITNGVQIMGFEEVPSTGIFNRGYFQFTSTATDSNITNTAKAIIELWENGIPIGKITQNFLTDYSIIAGTGINVTKKNNGVEIGSSTGNLKYSTLTSTEYSELTPNADTLYRLTDTNKVYLGSIELTGGGGTTEYGTVTVDNITTSVQSQDYTP